MVDIEHPDITWARKTGYSYSEQPTYYHCEKCGDELCSDEVYFDFEYECLCKECLLKLHKKEINDEDFS